MRGFLTLSKLLHATNVNTFTGHPQEKTMLLIQSLIIYNTQLTFNYFCGLFL